MRKSLKRCKKDYLARCLLLACFALLLAACAAPRPAGPPLPQEATLALAGFHHPVQNWQYLSSTGKARSMVAAPFPDPELMPRLDALLRTLLDEDGQRSTIGPDAVRQCQELMLAQVDTEQGGVSGMRYWTNVGACTQADYLLVPQILAWREREGGEWGVSQPGMVILELTLLDLRTNQVARRFLYDEQQRSLSEDLSHAGRFFQRGGKWVSTMELAEDGLRAGLREMGL